MSGIVRGAGGQYEVRSYMSQQQYTLVIVRSLDKAKAVFLGEDALQLDLDLEAAEAAESRGELPLDSNPYDFVCGGYDNVLQITH